MISNDVIFEIFNINNIIKEFPKSGQKKVILVNHKSYGDIILKIIESNDERIKREINIITTNEIRFVPKILEVDNYKYKDIIGTYIYEEYIEGNTLRNILSEGTMPLKEALIFTESMLKILANLEDISIVHRDIKPENIIKDNKGNWFLIDFGIARVLTDVSLTKTEVAMGPHTPGYGAPELFQYNKREIDSRADLFSLGVVLFESLTGKHPFINSDATDVSDIWYNTIEVKPDVIKIDGDKDMQFISLIGIFMEKHIARRPKDIKKAIEWFNVVMSNLSEEE